MKDIRHLARVIFYSVFGFYQLSTFIFTVMVDGHMDLFGLLDDIYKFKYIALVGITFVAIDYLWYRIERRGEKKREEAMIHENNVLKAKIYDFQEAAKATDTSKKV
jgi:hypothetical protein